MTDKQRVQKIYPDAHSRRIQRKKWPRKFTEIVRQNNEPFPWPLDFLGTPEWKRLSGPWDTAADAWRDAWQRVEVKMLKKLES